MKKAIYIIVGLLVLAGIVFVIVSPGKQAPSKLDAFAQCIKASGATFYGAFWCPHCAAQKAEFGTAVKYLPYVECSMPDGQTQTQVCIDHNITTYPTWEFPVTVPATATTTATTTMLRVEGVQELTQLAQETGCQLPADMDTTATTDASGSSTAPQQ